MSCYVCLSLPELFDNGIFHICHIHAFLKQEIKIKKNLSKLSTTLFRLSCGLFSSLGSFKPNRDSSTDFLTVLNEKR